MDADSAHASALAMLNASLADLPLPSDSVVVLRSAPAGEPAVTPAHYSQVVPASFFAPATFKRMEAETLFWAFYYGQGTVQQLMAAQELKKNFWRYHTRFRMWLQRHPRELPSEITPEYEKGSYVFFDNETNWTQRTRTDFTLQYADVL